MAGRVEDEVAMDKWGSDVVVQQMHTREADTSTSMMDAESGENDGVSSADTQNGHEGQTLVNFMNPTVGIIMSIITTVLYVADIGSDLWLAITYFKQGHVKWGAWTLSFFLLPHLFVFFGILLTQKGCGRIHGCASPIVPVWM